MKLVWDLDTGYGIDPDEYQRIMEGTNMMSKAELQASVEEAKTLIEAFRTDAKQARGNMGTMLDNLAAGMKKLTEVLEGLVEQMGELDAAARKDES